MQQIIRELIDISDFKETFFNTLYLFPDGKDKNIDDYFETNNKFGWNVTFAEIFYVRTTKLLVEYRLLSVEGIEQCHALKVKASEIDYWRFEFLGREIDHSPDFFEPNLENFLNFYYKEILHKEKAFKQEIAIPVVFYELNNDKKLKTIRYALSVNKLYTKPLFYISINNDGFLQSLSDWQAIDSKHIVYPTPDYPNSYLLQKFSNNQNGNLYRLENVKNTEPKVLIFKGFSDYKVKYLNDKETEYLLKNYGFFVEELRNIITETDLVLKYIPTVNYHLIKPCNMVCNHCFSDFSELNNDKLDLNSAKKIIREILKIKSFRKLNFSGGEPTLFKGIELLIRLAKENGLETSMVTNGFKLVKSKDLLNSLIGYLDLLVLSIDSLDEVVNLAVGRHVAKKTLSLNDFVGLAKKCDKNGIKIKINTVVTKNNFNQVLATDISILKPIRWKIFRMLPVANQNDNANSIYPTDDEFKKFLRLNKDIAEKLNIKVVSEDNNEMTGSYIMISPDGRFFNNIEGKHNYSESILEVGIENALNQTPLLREIFYKREGDYSCN
jgi:radical S-adenosyl methionine domain-containing protein 2